MDEHTNSQNKKQVICFALILGYLGALPFIGLSLFILLGNEQLANNVRPALHVYGAIILSFLGGLHWGRIAAKSQFLSSDKWALIYSVVPSLIGWSSYLLAIVWRESVWMLIGGFALAYFIDRVFILAGEWRTFMYSLRLHLTIVACFCLALSY